MGFWNRRPKEETPPPAPPQLRPAERHPFALIDGYVPLHEPAFDLYRAIREAVPVVDAAIRKLVRLAGGVGVTCPDKGVEAALNHFLRTVPAGWNQQGIQAFLDSYLDCLLTCGRAVGEIVPSRDGREIAAVLCGRVSDIQVREGDSPLEVVLAQKRPDGSVEDLPRQELLLFTPYHPSPENPYGVSLLRSMPFLAGVLLKIYQTLGANWERAGNVRFAVVYKPDGEADPRQVKERSQLLAQRWSEAMGSTRAGSVRDFVAVGDVEIRVIGAECDIPDCQAPVRLLLEQLISQTGIPPVSAGAELVLHRADEQPAGGHHDQRAHGSAADPDPGGGEDLRPVAAAAREGQRRSSGVGGDQPPGPGGGGPGGPLPPTGPAAGGGTAHPAQPGATENAWRGGDPWRQYGNRPEPKLTRWKGSWRPSTPWGTPA